MSSFYDIKELLFRLNLSCSIGLQNDYLFLEVSPFHFRLDPLSTFPTAIQVAQKGLITSCTSTDSPIFAHNVVLTVFK